MTAYFLFDVREIGDAEKLADYRARVFETVEAHGGCYRILGGPCEQIEGAWPIGIPVLIEFPDRDAALGWYGSEAYRPLLALRREAAEGAALLIEGFDHRPGAA